MKSKQKEIVQKFINFSQKWTEEQALNDLEKYLLRDEPPAKKPIAMAMAALDKQKPKKSINLLKMSYLPGCPNCEKYVSSGSNYCPNCGQALDRSEYDG